MKLKCQSKSFKRDVCYMLQTTKSGERSGQHKIMVIAIFARVCPKEDVSKPHHWIKLTLNSQVYLRKSSE